jgi:hypothetical protein
MAAGDDKNKNESAGGFAGLSGMLSDVDETIAQAKRSEATAPKDAPRSPPAAAEETAAPERHASPSAPASKPRPVLTSPHAPPVGPHPIPVAVWIVVAIAGVAVLSLASQQTSNRALGTGSPQALVEKVPEIGSDRVLEYSELVYCAAEKIRLDAGDSFVDENSEAQVNRFNALVQHFNSRCGSFRYQSTAWERARREVERHRAALEIEGQGRLVQALPSQVPVARSRPPLSPARIEGLPLPTPAEPDPLIQAIQTKLNELGYRAGTADGLMGAQTRRAIVAFQGDLALSKDGKPSKELLQWLEAAPSRANTQLPKATTATVRTVPDVNEPLEASVSDRNSRDGPRNGVAPDLSGLNAFERGTAERACDSRKYIGASSYYECLQSEVRALSRLSGMPDLSGLSAFERQTAERACDSRKYLGASSYYECLQSEVRALSRLSGMPDLSGLSAFERQTAERACDSRKYLGASSYYECLQSEVRALSRLSGMPDLSGLSAFERQTAERACDSRKYLGASSYYECLQSEVQTLSGHRQ